ncbi:hypothetical protein CRD60_03380 [Bifidobacterium aemilianum]|uniref:Transposase IS30-like HTH domain-containing protein n=2 Tax=Bifidobacterium aemilianum TaxID=2493120 RepID=A0A366K939_9BIFI|nr:hypothetical protein CRD60_03380 [Bifidobacterium aemilianum]
MVIRLEKPVGRKCRTVNPSYSHLSAHERHEIMAGVACGLSFRAIGRRLGRPASTVSREIRRNTWFTPPTTAGPGGPTGPHG